MRDSIGGAVNIVIIVAFIVIALSYLAFNVNYTKAFRMKNKIIATYENFGGECDGVSNTSGKLDPNGCFKAIDDYAHDVGYEPGELACKAGWTASNNNLYCYKEVLVNDKNKENKDIVNEDGIKKYYKIATRINIEIPIIQNVFGYQFFWVTGDTKTFTIK